MKRVGCNRVSPVFPNRGKIYGPLVKWLRHGPFTAVTWVRVPYGSPHRQSVRGLPTIGGLAQLVRAPASHAGGHWFESSSLHQKVPDFVRNQELFLFMISKVTRHFGVFCLTQTPRGQESTGDGRGRGCSPARPCAASPFYSFNPREYPTRTVWQNSQIQLAHPFFAMHIYNISCVWYC